MAWYEQRLNVELAGTWPAAHRGAPSSCAARSGVDCPYVWMKQQNLVLRKPWLQGISRSMGGGVRGPEGSTWRVGSGVQSGVWARLADLSRGRVHVYRGPSLSQASTRQISVLRKGYRGPAG